MIVTLEEMKDYLGEDGTNNDSVIAYLIISAQQELETSTGINLSSTTLIETAKRAIRIMVWLSFYADRDAAKNTQYIVAERDRLLTKLEWSSKVETT
ncbi:MAG: head-tail connector protein [Eubacteriaceae bacterium]